MVVAVLLCCASIAVVCVLPGTEAQSNPTQRHAWILVHPSAWCCAWCVVLVAMLGLAGQLWRSASGFDAPARWVFRGMVLLAAGFDSVGVGIMVFAYPAVSLARYSELQTAVLWLCPILATSVFSVCGLILVRSWHCPARIQAAIANLAWVAGFVLALGAWKDWMPLMAAGGAVMWTLMPWFCIQQDLQTQHSCSDSQACPSPAQDPTATVCRNVPEISQPRPSVFLHNQ